MTDELDTLREAYVEDAEQAFGEQLVSVIEYGETQTDGYVEGRSVIDILIIVREKNPEVVKRARQLARKWMGHRFNVPLIFAADSPRAALDSFPVEYLNLQNFSKLLWGADVLSSLICQPKYVKRECSHELKAKSVALYQALIELEDVKRDVPMVFRSSLASLVAVFRGLLYLKHAPVPAPSLDVLAATAALFGVDAALLERVQRVAFGELDLPESELETLLCDYCVAIQTIAKQVDAIAA